MKTNFVKRLLVFLILAAMMSSVCCAAEDTAPSVKCYNGTFVGMRENGIASFKGIPYAKPRSASCAGRHRNLWKQTMGPMTRRISGNPPSS